MALDELNSPGGDEIRAQSPFNRVATPEEIAAAVVYLASAEAEWASGARARANDSPNEFRPALLAP